MAAVPTPVLLWANTAAKTYIFRERGDIRGGPVGGENGVNGIMSCWYQQFDNYDNEEYRDEPFDLSAATNADVSVPTGDYIVVLEPDGAVPVDSTIPADKTSNDDALHIPPRPIKHKRTLFTYWDNAAGTGNVLYQVWSDRLESIVVSAEPYVFI